MLDEIFDMFERDGRRGRAAGERRGVRGFFARMFGGGDDDEDTRRSRHNAHDSDEDDDRYDDRYGDRAGRRRRERDNDGFDFGD